MQSCQLEMYDCIFKKWIRFEHFAFYIYVSIEMVILCAFPLKRTWPHLDLKWNDMLLMHPS